ncbi:NXPE family member 1-like [Bombina bombina]|uniref:NXPE family member 1-like n=1 Tax=Bombina bombina TaxID=8345 RepID=UPI00235A9C24|nr:NXPE family member 1-like [Bombina bombina]
MHYRAPSRSELKDVDLINQILSDINNSIPSIIVTNLNTTTCATKCRVQILDTAQKYSVGDFLTVQVEMFDYLGQRKTYGGDFFRARIYSTKLKAGASGTVRDFNNGTYHVYFTLFWEGDVTISILLMHPSEGVSALWKARNMGYKNIFYTGKFLNKTKEVHTECGYILDSPEGKCEYSDKRKEEHFYCIKPPGVPCEALIAMKSNNRPHTYLSNLEKGLFNGGSNMAVEIAKELKIVMVQKSQKNYTKDNSKCVTGMSLPFPSGYFFNNLWHPVFCNISSFEPLSKIKTCLSRKIIYLMGDSTIRQWIEFIPAVMPNVKFFDLHGIGWHKEMLALDLERNMYIMWKKHGHPFVTQSFFTVKNHAYIAQDIDRVAGGSSTVIVIALGQHFRPFPLIVFIRRLLSVRNAIVRLFHRSPDTKVIIKSENTREVNADVERFSDFHGYVQYLLMKDIFQGLNVGVIDAWDMTTAFGSFNVHPPTDVIRNQINMFLTYICDL